MKLEDYFAQVEGVGVLSTADSTGRVDAAIYASPHIMGNDLVAFIMRERLTHENLKSNPYAAYLFIENGNGYRGVRLFLKKTKEDKDQELIAQLTRRNLSAAEDAAKGPKSIVYFEVEKALALIGGEALTVE